MTEERKAIIVPRRPACSVTPGDPFIALDWLREMNEAYEAQVVRLKAKGLLPK